MILSLVPEGFFEIDDYTQPCYLYECIAPLRALMLQKTAPKKYKEVSTLIASKGSFVT